MSRERGYYWIKFPYRRWGMNKDPHWEVGSYDPDCDLWLLIGGNDGWLEGQLQEIGPRIPFPEIIELTKEMKKK